MVELQKASVLREQQEASMGLFNFNVFNDRIETLFSEEGRLQILIHVADRNWLMGMRGTAVGSMVLPDRTHYSDGIMADMTISEDACMPIVRYLRKAGYHVEILRMSVMFIMLRVSLEELV